MDLLNAKAAKINKSLSALNPFTKLATGVQKVAEKTSDVKDLVDTSRDDAIEFNKRLTKTVPELRDLYKNLKKPIDEGKMKYDKSFDLSIYMFVRYLTYKDACSDVSVQYEQLQQHMRDFPVAVEGEKLSDFAAEVCDCLEKAEARRQIERRKKQNPDEWKAEQEAAGSAEALTQTCAEVAAMEEKYAEMSTCDIIRSNKEHQAEVALYGERCSELWKLSGHLNREFVASKELNPIARYSKLKEMLRKLVNNRIYLEMCAHDEF